MSDMTRVCLQGVALGFTLALWGAQLSADSISTPTGEVILTVSGQVAITNQNGDAVFDREMLEALAPTTITTSTIWTEGEVEFFGASLAEVLRYLGVESGTLKATAINDYAVEIPVEDAMVEPAIIAYRMNGEPMSVRDKGPLWIVYPYDSDKKFQSEEYYARSIWQLDRIIVEE